jgi:hypothetical protein
MHICMHDAIFYHMHEAKYFFTAQRVARGIFTATDYLTQSHVT